MAEYRLGSSDSSSRECKGVVNSDAKIEGRDQLSEVVGIGQLQLIKAGVVVGKECCWVEGKRNEGGRRVFPKSIVCKAVRFAKGLAEK